MIVCPVEKTHQEVLNVYFWVFFFFWCWKFYLCILWISLSSICLRCIRFFWWKTFLNHWEGRVGLCEENKRENKMVYNATKRQWWWVDFFSKVEVNSTEKETRHWTQTLNRVRWRNSWLMFLLWSVYHLEL